MASESLRDVLVLKETLQLSKFLGKPGKYKHYSSVSLIVQVKGRERGKNKQDSVIQNYLNCTLLP